MPTVMITGCNRGIGLEFVRQYAGEGWKVIATCRNEKNTGILKAIDGDVEIQMLDVADFNAIDSLAVTLAGIPIDVLILNAAINPQLGARLADTDYQAWPDVMWVNVMAPARLATAFHPHLKAGKLKIVVALSSRVGSMTHNKAGGNYLYRTSKAALNAVIVGLASDFAEDGIIAVSTLPGLTRTDMGGPDAPRSPEQSVGDMRRVIEGLTLADSGSFIDFEGNELGW